MKILVSKEFKFDAAHNLTRYKGKCERLHGHTYRLRVTVEGTLNDEDMVIDFGELKQIVQEKIINLLDHSYLNDMFDNPTTERVALWIWNQLQDALNGPNYKLKEVILWETETSFVRVTD
ncbi:MAG: 6-carboxytetrahydropterin synthase QueD [Candidatus Hydrothermota bacterium]|nr:MAG: 6-carboxytetrahydropterin synthase QueD [Candidatus Hydrothermae bacterium]